MYDECASIFNIATVTQTAFQPSVNRLCSTALVNCGERMFASLFTIHGLCYLKIHFIPSGKAPAEMV